MQNILQQIEPIFEQKDWSFVGMFIDQEYTALFSELSAYNIEMSYEEDFSDYVYQTSDLANLKGKSIALNAIMSIALFVIMRNLNIVL